jgi:hypothetical protein
MQIELDHISRREAFGWQGGEEEFGDDPITRHSDGAGGCSGGMGGDNDSTWMSLRSDRQWPAIKQSPADATLRVGKLLIGRQGQAHFYLRQIKQLVVFSSHHPADSGGDQIYDDGPVAIQPIKADESLTW